MLSCSDLFSFHDAGFGLGPICTMGEEDGGKSVLLVITQGEHGSGARSLLRVADGWEMGCEEWQALVAEAEYLDGLCIRVDRELLLEHSSYFMSFENFSESNRESINVDWSLPVFCSLLQCIHGFYSSFSPSMVAPLIQVAPLLHHLNGLLSVGGCIIFSV